MTNITLSINEETYIKMKAHSEIKWSEFVRKEIEKKIKILESIEENNNLMKLCEDDFRKDWDNDLDKRWDNV